MKSIYLYNDYRTFLKDYFEERKQKKREFSHRYFAQKAGFSSSSHVHKIINGARNITKYSLPKVADAMELKSKKREYFKLLVEFNQTKDINEKETCFKKISAIRNQSKVFKLDQKHIKYYQKWYYPIIRSLAVYSNWNGDYSILAKLVDPPIRPDEAKRAVEVLVDIGLLSGNEKGEYYQDQKLITAEDVPVFFKSKARKEILESGINAATQKTADERYISTTLLTLSKSTYNKITQMLKETDDASMSIAYDERKPEKLYQMVLQIFPVSKDMPLITKNEN